MPRDARHPKRHGSDQVHKSSQGRGSLWRVSAALLFCFGTGIAGLHTVIQDGVWWFGVFFLVVAVLGTAAVARSVATRRWVPTLASSLALIILLTVIFAARSAFLFVVPTFGTLAELNELGQAGALSIRDQSVPAELNAGIMFLLCVGIGSLAIVADVIAVEWRRPVLAGVPLAVLLGVPGYIGANYTDIFYFMLAAIAWLVLLRAGQPLRQTARALGIGVAAVVVALLAPLVFPPVDGSLANESASSGYLSGVNPVLRLGDDLRQQLPRTILQYTSSTDSPTYLRLVSLQNFTAETWEPDSPVVNRVNLPSDIGPAPGLAPDVRVEFEEVHVDAANLGSPWLPMPYPATSVRGLSGDWFWDADDLTLSSPDGTARGEDYRVESLLVRPTPQQLTSAGAVVPAGLERYLELPEDMPAIIATTAAEVSESATSNYGMAVALQEFFRDGAFTYSETAPVEQGYDGNGMEMLAVFLDVKSGYCIHFASAMAVMARTLGIPSRVAVGFSPGEQSDEPVSGEGSFRVTTRDVHSWPELYFDGIGWTRFEPTPGVGFVPTYADEATPGVPVPPSTDPAASPSPTPSATASAPLLDRDDSSASAQDAAASFAWLWPALILFVLVLILLLPALVRSLQRIIRLRRLARGSPVATTGWRELLQTAEDLGVEIGETATPRMAAQRIAKVARLGAADWSSLERTLHTVERQSFARGNFPAIGPAAVGQVDTILSRLRSSASLRTRIIAALAPPSIWSRLIGLLGLPARTAALTRVR